MQKLFRWFRRTQLWGTGDWQLYHKDMPVHASCLMQNFLVKHQITQVTQPPLHPIFGALRLLAFPKTKITFEREEISDHWWDLGNIMGQLIVTGRTVKSQGAYFEGNWCIIVLCTMFLVSVSSSINISIFHITCLDTFWTDFVCEMTYRGCYISLLSLLLSLC